MEASAEPWLDERWPVSVKGVLMWGDEVVVLRNEREEWELPGGRLDAGDDSPRSALQREFREELGLEIEVGDLLDTWIYDVAGNRVLIVTHVVSAERPAALKFSHEHSAVATFTFDQLRHESIPAGYINSIKAAVSA